MGEEVGEEMGGTAHCMQCGFFMMGTHCSVWAKGWSHLLFKGICSEVQRVVQMDRFLRGKQGGELGGSCSS